MANETRSENSWMDDIATRFDRAWKVGREPRIEEYLNEVEEPLRPRLLRELLLIEREVLETRGETLDPERYGSAGQG